MLFTGLADRTALVGLEGGVDAVGGGAVGDGAVHLSVGLAATPLAAGQLAHERRTHTHTYRSIKGHLDEGLWVD